MSGDRSVRGLIAYSRMSLFFRTIEINWLATIEFQLTALARFYDIGVLLSLCVTTAGQLYSLSDVLIRVHRSTLVSHGETAIFAQGRYHFQYKRPRIFARGVYTKR